MRKKITWIWITLAAVFCIGCTAVPTNAPPPETNRFSSEDVSGQASTTAPDHSPAEKTPTVQEIADSKPASANIRSPLSGIDYIGNKNTKKFHHDWCSSIGQMKESNKYYYTGNRENMIEQGFEPCAKCHP
ncbi:MAG: hypothetical protein IJ955_04785 [Oscillospiraceae bacterium]|nr:hypothetical protein [Oscillospiraceae bacterium]